MVHPRKLVQRRFLTNAFCYLRSYITCTKIRNRPDYNRSMQTKLKALFISVVCDDTRQPCQQIAEARFPAIIGSAKFMNI